MAEMKMSKGRRKKEVARSTDDVLHNLVGAPVHGAASTSTHVTNGASVTNGTAHDAAHGAHAMDAGHRINGEHHIAIDENERRRLVAEAAYYRALRRGFANGSPETDWLEAEAEIVALLANAGMRV